MNELKKMKLKEVHKDLEIVFLMNYWAIEKEKQNDEFRMV